MSTVTDLQAAVAGILDSELPDATTKLYHGIPVWCVGDEPTIGIKPAKAHLSVLFFQGQRLLDGARADATGRLVASGSFEMASVKLASPEDLDEDALRGWVRAAKVLS
jgi:hypothetical protein